MRKMYGPFIEGARNRNLETLAMILKAYKPPKTKEYLATAQGYCCLGVAAVAAGFSCKPSDEPHFAISFDGEHKESFWPEDKFQALFGDMTMQYRLSAVNDKTDNWDVVAALLMAEATRPPTLEDTVTMEEEAAIDEAIAKVRVTIADLPSVS